MIASKPNEHELMQNNQFLKPFLTLPMFYRVLITNSAIILIGATVGTWLATRLNNNSLATAGLLVFVGVGWLVSVAMNFVLLQVTFRPLVVLRKVMSRVQNGERALRVPLTGLDPEADQLASAFNMMLETIDRTERQRATQILNAQEEERKRIARELHDETSQVLTSLLISLAILEESITASEARARIAETRQLAHQTLRAIRNLSLDLRPSALDDLGLLPALRWYVKEYQQKFSIEVEFQAAGFKERLPTEKETALYRIVQESLTNAARHGHAHKIRVLLEEDEQEIQVRVVDDGSGFDIEKLQKAPGPGQERGWGLVGMRERAALLGGHLEIHAKPGQGTSIYARIPQSTQLAELAGSKEQLSV
jgi:two-component system sensor histidine kinase UhpB